ncbi:MAG: hypothetical protein JNK33_04540, partial [Candidatus Doudnabacteria bacterium]|nr:hypothetical protein [Candidatus Doudnabacteria bacterium]
MSGFVSAASAVVPRRAQRWLALARYKVHATFAFALVALCSVSTGVLAWQAAQESFVLDQDVAVVVHRSSQQPGAVLGAVAQPAVWTGLVNTVVAGNTLAANGGASDSRTDKAAQASQPISQFGDGYFEFKKDQDSRGVVVGLGESGLSIPRTISLPYALEFYETYVEVRENGVYKADTRYVAGDTFKIEVVGTRILYSKNGVTFHDTDGFAKYTLTAYATFTQIGQSISAALVASEGLTTTPPPPATLPTISSFTATPT